MSKPEGFDAEISRRKLLQAATVLAVVPATLGAGVAIAQQAPPPSPAPTTPPPPTSPTTPTTTPTMPTTPGAPVRNTQLFWTTEIDSGRVMGVAQGPVIQFKGIPYGASTGGDNRYLPPRSPARWSGVRECFAHGQIAPQTLSSLQSEYGRLINWDQHPGGMGEDCLVLNVWTPSLDRNAKKAVLVSFHGGGFTSGSGNTLGFDGAMMALTHDVVVVTINHRLSAFGYLNLIDLGAPDEFQYAGVAGIMDMTASLEWVRDNIEGFGGNPGQVMIFGQSGGGAKTSIMLANPAAEGLFHRAAIQSGSALRIAEPATAAQNAELLLAALDVPLDDIARIQRRSWQEILQAMSTLTPATPPAPGAPAATVQFSPVMDGEYLPHHPFDPTGPLESLNVPVIISSTLHDSALSLTNFNLDDAGLRAAVALRFGEANADAIIAAQKAARPQDSNYLIQASAFTDASRGRATLVQAERKAALNGAPVWVYEWDWISNMADSKFGAVHGIDVSPCFNNWRDAMMSTGAAAGKEICNKFAAAWAAFAKTGNPNTPEIPEWPAFNATDRAIMVWDTETRVVNDHRGDLIRMLPPPMPVAPPAPAPTPATTPTPTPTTMPT
jgi:para-nitrobenzyl esterase